VRELSDAEKKEIGKYAQTFKKGSTTPKNTEILQKLGNIGLNTDNKLKSGLYYLIEKWPKGRGSVRKDTWAPNTIARFGELPKLGR